MDELPLTTCTQHLLNDISFSPGIVYLIIIIGLLLSGVGLGLSPFFISPTCSTQSSFVPVWSQTLGTYIQLGLGFIFVILYLLLRSKFKLLKYYGYRDFFRKTRLYHVGPPWIFFIGNGTVLLLNCLLHDCFATGLWITIAVETLISFLLLLALLYVTYKFVKQRNPPDVQLNEQFLVVTDIQPVLEPHGVRGVTMVEELLQKQADVIHYQHQHVKMLSEKILALTHSHR